MSSVELTCQTSTLWNSALPALAALGGAMIGGFSTYFVTNKSLKVAAKEEKKRLLRMKAEELYLSICELEQKLNISSLEPYLQQAPNYNGREPIDLFPITSKVSLYLSLYFYWLKEEKAQFETLIKKSAELKVKLILGKFADQEKQKKAADENLEFLRLVSTYCADLREKLKIWAEKL